MMPAQTLAADATGRPALGSRFDGAAMRDQASLIDVHLHGLRRFACALLRGDRQPADDLVQDCLEHAVPRSHLRRAEGDVGGWLYTILYNRFLNDKHRQRRRGLADALLEVPEAELPGVDGGQNRALEHRELLSVFAALPEEQQSVVLLIGVEDLSFEQAGRVLGVPIATMMSRVSHGRERLQHYMHGNLNGDQWRNAELRRAK